MVVELTDLLNDTQHPYDGIHCQVHWPLLLGAEQEDLQGAGAFVNHSGETGKAVVRSLEALSKLDDQV